MEPFDWLWNRVPNRVGNWRPSICNGMGSPRRVTNWSPSIGYGIGSTKRVVPPRAWVTGALRLAME